MPRGGGRVEKKKPRTYYRYVLSGLDAELQQAQQAVEQLLSERKEQAHREQVLVDTILQLEDVIVFRLVFDAQLAADAISGPQQLQSAEQQQQGVTQPEKHQSIGPCSRYVTSLLAKVSTETVQAVLNWQVEDWSNFVSNTSKQLAILLDLTDRENDGFPEQDSDGSETYKRVAQQQLEELVDDYITKGSLGVIYADITGQKVGACNATNHITGQIEAPSPFHWQRVVRRLQLKQQQRRQLAAGYRQFVLVRRLQQQAQHAIAKLVACQNSCSLQVQAAAKEAAEREALVKEVSAAPSNSASSASATVSVWDFLAGEGESSPVEVAASSQGPTAAAAAAAAARSTAAPAAAGAAAAADANASDEPEEEPDLLKLTGRLLFLWNQSAVVLALLLFNTLTKQQLARMVVASFPFVPRPGPLVEAVVHALPVFGEDAEEDAAVAAEADEYSGLELQQHVELRSSILSQQHERWWEDHDQRQYQQQQQHRQL